MGLDMFLTQKIYVGANYKHREVTGKCDIKIGDKELNIPFNKIQDIESEAGYWRNANAIHKWFVENVQEGEDNCQEYYVSHKELLELKDACSRVLENKSLAEELLPSTSGFFFGSTQYDEYYYQDLEHTIELINGLDPEGDYYYQASW